MRKYRNHNRGIIQLYHYTNVSQVPAVPITKWVDKMWRGPRLMHHIASFMAINLLLAVLVEYLVLLFHGSFNQICAILARVNSIGCIAYRVKQF